MNTQSFSSAEELSDFLQQHWVDIEQYGKQLSDGRVAKEIWALLKEIEEWESTLEVDEKTWELIRKIRVLNIKVLYGDMELYEEKQVFKDNDWNEIPEKIRVRKLESSVWEKMQPGESPADPVMRAIQEELGILLSENQLPAWYTIENPPRTQSPSYPWIQNESSIISTTITLNDAQYNPDGYTEEQADKNTYFQWRKRAI